MNKYSVLITSICCSLAISMSSFANQPNQVKLFVHSGTSTPIALSANSEQTMLVTDLHLFEYPEYDSVNLLEQHANVTLANYPIEQQVEHYQPATPNVIFDYALIVTDKIQSLVAAWQQFWRQTKVTANQTDKHLTNSQCQHKSSTSA